MAAVMSNTFDSRPASAGPMAEMHAPPQRPVSAHSMQPAHAPYPNSSPLLAHDQSAFQAPPAFKPFSNYTLPSPVPAPFIPPYSASYYPVFDVKNRTVSHAHPMYSADHTQSSRYSTSPPSHGNHHLAPPSAAPGTAHWHQTPQLQTPVLSVHEPPHDGNGRQHINPSMISYSMSRSASNGSASEADINNLLTPHLGYRENISPGPQDVRKVSDSLRPFDNRYDAYNGNVYNQPGMTYWGRNQQPPQIHSLHERKEDVYENEYERERQAQISGNKRLLEELGLGHGSGYHRPRHASNIQQRRPSMKKRLTHDATRASPRIAGIHRSVSYADLDGGRDDDSSGYSEEDSYEEDDFRPSKRGRGFGKMHKPAHLRRKADLSLWGLFQVYPSILELYPLFYYTLLNDLSINSESVPLIGSIANTVKPVDKAETLRSFFHRGRRVLAQLDSFTARCDRKYEGPLERWPEMDHHTRIAIRDVRRKVVERCENYKYTRRDILNKAMGKNNWEPIESNMIEWKYGQTSGDPAGDISHVSLTQPSMPAHIAAQHQAILPPPIQLPFASPAPQQMSYSIPEQRAIRPMPSRARLNSSGPVPIPYTPQTQHTALISGAPFTGHASNYAYSAMPPSAMHTPQVQHTPMYGEDQVPMTVQMPLAPLHQQMQQPQQHQQHQQPHQLATPQPISAMPSSILSAVPPTAAPINTTPWMPEATQHHGEPSPVDEIVASMQKNRENKDRDDDE